MPRSPQRTTEPVWLMVHPCPSRSDSSANLLFLFWGQWLLHSPQHGLWYSLHLLRVKQENPERTFKLPTTGAHYCHTESINSQDHLAGIQDNTSYHNPIMIVSVTSSEESGIRTEGRNQLYNLGKNKKNNSHSSLLATYWLTIYYPLVLLIVRLAQNASIARIAKMSLKTVLAFQWKRFHSLRALPVLIQNMVFLVCVPLQSLTSVINPFPYSSDILKPNLGHMQTATLDKAKFMIFLISGNVIGKKVVT